MTNRNLTLNKPFLLKPIGKDYLWGGNRLNEDFSKGINLTPLAESWECSTHPDGVSIVNSGEYKGKLLTEVLNSHPEYLGTRNSASAMLPILIKFIDTQKDLSIQVHPTDEYAREHENGQLGKSEFWYVLDATKDAKLVFGLHHDIKKETLRKSIEDDGTIEKYLQYVPVKTDDVFFIKAGTIHAIGAGVLIAEIQQNSNLTYRLYDYNRIDKNGKTRDLHIEKALDVANLSANKEPTQPLRVLKYKQGYASELLVRSQYFQVERLLINTERIRDLVDLKTNDLSFQVLLCLKGSGTLGFTDECLRFFKGDCIFLPANSVDIKIHGNAQFLSVHS